METELILNNARVVLPSEVVKGAVRIRAGKIADVQPGVMSIPSAVDCENDYLIPGLVELHTDNVEQQLRPRPTAAWPIMPALVAHDAQIAAAGITTVLDALCVGSVTATGTTRNFELLRQTLSALEVGRQHHMFRAEHLLHIRAELSADDVVRTFAQVADHPSLRLVSFMDHTPGQRQFANQMNPQMRKRFATLSQPEIDEFVQKRQEYHRKFAEPNRRRLLAIVSDHPVARASHDDTTVEHVEQAHAEGCTIAEFPTTVVAAEAAHRKEMKVVAGAPNLVLGGSHSGNVSAEELARRELLDALSSDYVPASLLNGAFLIAQKLGRPLNETLKLVSLNPAKLVGLEDRGSVEVGRRADLVRVKCVQGIPLAAMVWREGMRVA